MKQVVAEPQVEERPVQRRGSRTTSGRATNAEVVAEPQVEEHSVRVVAEPQVEEQPIQQVVVEQVQKPISSTEVQEKAYVVNQRENDMRNVLHTPPTYNCSAISAVVDSTAISVR